MSTNKKTQPQKAIEKVPADRDSDEEEDTLNKVKNKNNASKNTAHSKSRPMPSNCPQEKKNKNMKLISLIEECDVGCLKPNNYSCGATCTKFKKKVVNENVSDEDESSKIVLNYKNALLTCDHHRASKAVCCNFFVCLECVVAISNKK